MQRLFAVLAPILIAALCPAANAALGGKVDSIASDQTHTRAQLRAVQSNGYTIQNLVTEAGVNVREYVSTQGVVFAVAWNGPTMPDLKLFLGTYFPQFSEAMSQRRNHGIRGPVALQQDDLVVESSGHVRAYFGRAYIPGLLPPQVSLTEIQ